MTNREESEIWKCLKWNRKGYWYYSVPTIMRRNGEMKVSALKYNKLKAKYAKERNQIPKDRQVTC